ncbi:hypothetical protein F4819DRAFT_318379 [Hypoxylon fuscum]|nr:hypothetical protein F4819DRAFT_318379 [Hypoxylon fuscum]
MAGYFDILIFVFILVAVLSQTVTSNHLEHLSSFGSHAIVDSQRCDSDTRTYILLSDRIYLLSFVDNPSQVKLSKTNTNHHLCLKIPATCQRPYPTYLPHVDSYLRTYSSSGVPASHHIFFPYLNLHMSSLIRPNLD